MNKSKIFALLSGFFLFASSIMLVVVGILYNYSTNNLFYYLNSIDVFAAASLASLAIGCVICALANKKHYFVLIPTILSFIFALVAPFNLYYINLNFVIRAVSLFLLVIISIFAALPQLEKAFKVIRFFVILPALIFIASSVLNAVFNFIYFSTYDAFYFTYNFEEGFYVENIMGIVIAAFAVIGFILFSIWLALPAVAVQSKKQQMQPQAANAPSFAPNAGYNPNFNQNPNQGFNPQQNQGFNPNQGVNPQQNQGFNPNQGVNPQQNQGFNPNNQQMSTPQGPTTFEPQVQPMKQMRHLSESEIMELNNFTVLFESGKISKLEYEANKNYLLFDKKD